jgi:pimeloyl-ACP methyl ester carboxylesterase
MNADPRDFSKLVSGTTAAEPIYFDSAGTKLFGWLHQPLDGRVAKLGLVICKPFGYEVMCSHTSLRTFADAAAELGVPALRFDYRGTGDSSDIDPQGNQLEVWTQDVLAAIVELERRCGVKRVCLFGLRLGALLASLAAAQSRSVASLILIAPVVSGRRYLRELRMAQLAAQIGKSRSGAAATSDATSAAAEASEFSGYTLSAATLAALVEIDLTALPAPASELLIIDADNHPASRGWTEVLAAQQARVKYLTLPGLVGMLITAPHFAQVPREMVAAMDDWLRRSLDHETLRPHSVDPKQPGVESAISMNMQLLPGPDNAADATLTERPVFFATDAVLFGIVTELSHWRQSHACLTRPPLGAARVHCPTHGPRGLGRQRQTTKSAG